MLKKNMNIPWEKQRKHQTEEKNLSFPATATQAAANGAGILHRYISETKSSPKDRLSTCDQHNQPMRSPFTSARGESLS